ncbi:hypothetical protein COU37_00195 [Candidatus Micrarchaeota archaeon CG10_big_fil_rev_8_21_14_0_10_45_29]|nr:MAG: hypothetical protein COU37_00195 [Candidatus Micrarchaeota archaeon CG10_big_fil_rev_8_21_14_0_10_45_29]
MSKLIETAAGSRAEQNYLLAIYQISKNKGVASTGDIAKVLKVRSPSVTNMLDNLEKKSLITYRKYQGAMLAPEGAGVVKSLTARANVFKRFLSRIGVPAHLVEKDSHVLESGLSAQSMRKMEKFVRFVDLFGEHPCFFEHFKKYCEGGVPQERGNCACSLKMVMKKKMPGKK